MNYEVPMTKIQVSALHFKRCVALRIAWILPFQNAQGLEFSEGKRSMNFSAFGVFSGKKISYALLTVRRRQLALAEISARIQIKQDKGNAENWPQQRPD